MAKPKQTLITKIKLDIDHFKHFIILVTAIIKRNGKFLLVQRRPESKTFPEFWQLPEGKLELGEQPVETLKRELNEELGCKVKKVKFVEALTLTFPIGSQEMHLLRIIAKVTLEGKIKLSSEHSRYLWLTKQALLKHPGLVPGIKEIIKSKNV